MVTLSGVLPIAPTAFRDDEELDHESQRRALEFLIAARSDAICILANFSEQYSLSDHERDELVVLAMDEVAGRVPVIVTASHFSTKVTVERCRRAAAVRGGRRHADAAIPWGDRPAGRPGVRAYFETVASAVDLPIIIQDSPVSGTHLSVETLHHLTEAVPSIGYLKLETPDATTKLMELIALRGSGLIGPFDGEEGVNVIADLDAGITGTMPSAMIPDVIGEIIRLRLSGDRVAAQALYARWLPLILFENRQCGLRATKVLMHEGGIIRSEATRRPLAPLNPKLRTGLIELATRLDPLVLRWGRA